MYVLLSTVVLINSIDKLINGFDGFWDVVQRRAISKIF